MKYLDCVTLLYFTSSNVDKPCLVLIEELPSSTSSVDGKRQKKKLLYFVLSVTIIIVILIMMMIVAALDFNLENMTIGQAAHQQQQQQQKNKQGPSLQIPYKSLKVELVTEGLSFPTSMEFIDNNNILVLQKDNGTVHLVSNGILQKK